MGDEDDAEMAKNLPRCMIAPNSKFKTIWNLLMLFLIVFISLTVPYRIPFEDNITNTWLFIDELIDIVFLCDIFINFNTVYEDEQGELVVSRKKIGLTYIKSWFLVDLVSCVPISLIFKLS